MQKRVLTLEYLNNNLHNRFCFDFNEQQAKPISTHQCAVSNEKFMKVANAT